MKMLMKNFSLLYPKVAKFIADTPCPTETFLFDVASNAEYPFWVEFEYFLSNSDRLGNTNEIFRKLSSVASLSLDIATAWGRHRDFRSAQFEVTVIFLIEKCFGGKAQIIPESNVPTPDFEVELNQGKFTIEAKAQSGQQHSDKHPRHNGQILFDPKEEVDLRSWLFEERISSRNGRAMEPQVVAAEKKGADILVCQTDYVKTEQDLLSQIRILCPKSQFAERMTLQIANRKPIEVQFFQATYPYTRQPIKLKEIWLCNLSSSHYRLVVLSRRDAILRSHLKLRR
jgi:hypothetical protein